MHRNTLFLLSFLLIACSGNNPTSDLASACQASTNIDSKGCECIANIATNELPESSVYFLIASMSKNKSTLKYLRSNMKPAELIQAGMFMVNAPKRCAMLN